MGTRVGGQTPSAFGPRCADAPDGAPGRRGRDFGSPVGRWRPAAQGISHIKELSIFTRGGVGVKPSQRPGHAAGYGHGLPALGVLG